MTFDDAMRDYGNDKPDLRFGMKLANVKVKGEVQALVLNEVPFKIFEEAETIIAVIVKGGSEYTRKQLDELTDWVKRPQIGNERPGYM